ncbi:HNH endonuclease [Aureimonas phyllosphaerae]|uniref:HNH endonuclease n=1 Tax=Aureimonas phyllosphaerae TaxID=1166078 RepID=UPI003A5BDDFF
MARTVKEWRGRTDDSMPGTNVKLRIAARHGDACPSCTRSLADVKSTACDHITPLADGGENVESNLQILCGDCHGKKTSAEASERAAVRSLKAKHLKLGGKPTHPNFRKPDGTHYDWGRGGRLARDASR